MEIRKIQGSKMSIENLKKKGLHLKIYHFNNLKLKLKENSTRIMFWHTSHPQKHQKTYTITNVVR